MKINKCVECSTYTLGQTCPRCNGHARVAAPAKYSPQDPYGKYRRLMKESMNDG